MNSIKAFILIFLINPLLFSQPVSLSNIEDGILKGKDDLIEFLLENEWVFLARIEHPWSDIYPETQIKEGEETSQDVRTQNGFMYSLSPNTLLTIIENDRAMTPYIGVDLEIDQELKMIYDYILGHIKLNYSKTRTFYDEKLYLANSPGYVTEYIRKVDGMKNGKKGISVHTYKAINYEKGTIMHYIIFNIF